MTSLLVVAGEAAHGRQRSGRRRRREWPVLGAVLLAKDLMLADKLQQLDGVKSFALLVEDSS